MAPSNSAGPTCFGRTPSRGTGTAGCNVGSVSFARSLTNLLDCPRANLPPLSPADPEFDPVDPMPMPPPNEFNFLGSDRRIYPGGPVIFVIAGTDDMTTNDLSGVFRQGHDAVSCRAGLSDYFRNDQGAEVDTTTCAYRCRNADTYIEWLEYCAADEEDTSLGFSGYDM